MTANENQGILLILLIWFLIFFQWLRKTFFLKIQLHIKASKLIILSAYIKDMEFWLCNVRHNFSIIKNSQKLVWYYDMSNLIKFWDFHKIKKLYFCPKIFKNVHFSFYFFIIAFWLQIFLEFCNLVYRHWNQWVFLEFFRCRRRILTNQGSRSMAQKLVELKTVCLSVGVTGGHRISSSPFWHFLVI